MKKALLAILLLTFSFGSSQELTGYVYLEADGKPLEGASVYFDGSTISTTTDASGYFTITPPANRDLPLVVRFMGFQTHKIEVPNPDRILKITLKEDPVALKEVVINKKSPFTRKEMMRAFRSQFLGNRGGAHCKILNEQDIYLRYDTSTNTLTASSVKPILIENSYLDYQLNFDLQSFEVNYSYLTLYDENVRSSYFAGTTSFSDLAQRRNADKKRKAAYRGSVVHFTRTLAYGDLQEQNYQLYSDRNPVDFDTYFKISDTANFKKVEIIDIPASTKTLRKAMRSNGVSAVRKNLPRFADVKFTVMHNGREQSELYFNRGYFYIDSNGIFSPIFEVSFAGYMGELKAGDLLPNDYVP